MPTICFSTVKSTPELTELALAREIHELLQAISPKPNCQTSSGIQRERERVIEYKLPGLKKGFLGVFFFFRNIKLSISKLDFTKCTTSTQQWFMTLA